MQLQRTDVNCLLEWSRLKHLETTAVAMGIVEYGRESLRAFPGMRQLEAE